MALGRMLQPTRPAAHQARARPVAPKRLSLADDAVILLTSEGATAPPLALA